MMSKENILSNDIDLAVGLTLPEAEKSAPEPERPRGWRRLTFEGKCWLFCCTLLMICGGFYLGFWYSCQNPRPIDVPYVTSDSYYENQKAAQAVFKDYLGSDGILTVLLLGCDMREGEDVGRSDTIMLAFVDLQGGGINLLSIPRDTRVELAEGRGVTKINHAFAYGRVPLVRKTIENFLNVEIDRYVTVDFQGFADIIDALGGIDYNVEQRMLNEWENIDLQPGQQHLNGSQALSYVRWREPVKADIGRVERQQAFLGAVLDQVMSVGTIFRLPRLIGTINDSIQTDFSLKELTSLIEIYQQFVSVDFNSAMVPGDGVYINGISYWQYDLAKTQELVASMQNFATINTNTGDTD